MVKLILVRVAIGLVAYFASGPTVAGSDSYDQPLNAGCRNLHKCRSSSTCVQAMPGCIIGNRLAGLENNHVNEYLGIPYAKAPVGELRFSDPIEAPYWSGVFSATKYGPSCMFSKDTVFPSTLWAAEMWNPPGTQNEDCLSINVWAPANKKDLPVMVWIYGGGFYSGSSSLALYNGSTLASANDVIVVSFNYRTAVLGFLSTGDNKIKGNFGLEDQLLALKWVKTYIPAFGGNPRKVTLFGESAGAASIGFHLLSEKSRDLYQRVIMESASATSPWAFMSKAEAKKRSDFYLKSIKCDSDSREAILRCLRSLPARNLTFDFVDYITVKNPDRFPWVPTVDGSFLKDTPRRLIEQGRYNKDVDVLTGYNNNEATYFQLYNFHSELNETMDTITINNEQYRRLANEVVKDLPAQKRQKMIEIYSKGKSQNELLRALDELEGDRNFICSVIDLVKLYPHSEHGNPHSTHAYLYEFKHRASNEQWPSWMGVIHGGEIQWVFGVPLSPAYVSILRAHGISDYTEDERKFARSFMRNLVSFAKTGNTYDNWPLYYESQKRQMVIESDMGYHSTPATQDLWDRCKKWAKYEKRANCCEL